MMLLTPATMSKGADDFQLHPVHASPTYTRSTSASSANANPVHAKPLGDSHPSVSFQNQATPTSASITSLEEMEESDRITIEEQIRNKRMLRWARRGIILGDEHGDLRPDGVITRAEIAAIINRLVGYSSQATETPRDVSVSDWFYSDVMKLKAANVMQGSDGYFRPRDLMTREEAITTISRAFRISGQINNSAPFSDWDQINDWAKGYVSNMWEAGYLGDFGDELSPQSYITRMEAILIIDSMFEEIYAQPGTYSETIAGNVIIRAPGIKLIGAHIQGDVYIVEGVGDGYYTIDESTVIDGEIFAFSGRRNPYAYIDPEAPMVALTFDDGPSPTTPRILDTLETYGARATFFVVGQMVASYAETEQRAVRIGCELAGHTWSHTAMTSMSESTLIADTERVANAIYETVGVRPTIVRPPYGSVNSSVLSSLGSIGIPAIYWSIDPQDWSHGNASTTYSHIMDRVQDGAIVLMHDIVASTATAVEWMVPELIAKGYQLVTVSELLAYSDGGLQPGTLYYSRNG